MKSAGIVTLRTGSYVPNPVVRRVGDPKRRCTIVGFSSSCGEMSCVRRWCQNAKAVFSAVKSIYNTNAREVTHGEHLRASSSSWRPGCKGTSCPTLLHPKRNENDLCENEGRTRIKVNTFLVTNLEHVTVAL